MYILIIVSVSFSIKIYIEVYKTFKLACNYSLLCMVFWIDYKKISLSDKIDILSERRHQIDL